MKCPRCADDVALVPSFGALTEDVCATCKGRFLPPPVVERVIVDELGVTQDVLRELTALFASKERLVCPSCSSKLSAVHVRKVRVDLCTGCGGAWLDAGELRALTQGRHEELTPEAVVTSAAAPAREGIALEGDDTSDTDPTIGPATSGRVVVFFDEPAQVTKESLANAFANLAGLTAADAAQIVANQRPTVVEGATEQQAQEVLMALTHQGIAAHVADISWISLPAAYTTNALSVDAHGITLGRADVSVGRVVAPWSEVAAIAVGNLVRSSMKRVPGNRPAPARASDGNEYDVSVVEAADTIVEVVLTSPPRRYRLWLSTLIFGETGRVRAVVFRERMAALLAGAPNTVALSRGVRAVAEGRAPPRYPSLRDVEREVGWLLWRNYGRASG